MCVAREHGGLGNVARIVKKVAQPVMRRADTLFNNETHRADLSG
jgi:hypothetical protein